MPDVKSGPIAGIIGVVALIGLAVTMLRQGASLPQEVDAFLERDSGENPAARHKDAPGRIQEAEALVNDSQFDKLPASKQEQVRGRLRELKAYQEYVAKLDKITPPRDAHGLEQLDQIKSGLVALTAPIEYQVEWSQTEAGMRHRAWLQDVEAIEKAVDELMKGYEKLAAEGREVLKDAEAANLPKRARKVLADARKLPSPESDKDKRLPQSAGVTYATVFAFPVVQHAYREWTAPREKLQRLAELGKP